MMLDNNSLLSYDFFFPLYEHMIPRSNEGSGINEGIWYNFTNFCNLN